MPSTLNPACPLCGLRFSNGPLLDLHIREDHVNRDRPAESGHGDSGDTGTSLVRAEAIIRSARAPQPGPPPDAPAAEEDAQPASVTTSAGRAA